MNIVGEIFEDDGLLKAATALNLWTSSGGKVRLAKMLLGLFEPAGGHDGYGEAFAGSAAVFMRKERVAREYLNDRDEELANTYKLVQGLSDQDVQKIVDMDWTGSRSKWKALEATDPSTLPPTERVHRYMYLSRHAFGNMISAGFEPAAEGKVSKIANRILRGRDRLKGVNISSGDYSDAVMRHDAETTLHFLDPPYPGYNARIGENDFDERRWMEMLKALKGKFLITYGVRGEFPAMLKDTDWNVKRIYPARAYAVTGNQGSATRTGTLIVTNYAGVAKLNKAIESAGLIELPWDESVRQELIENPEVSHLPRRSIAKRMWPSVPLMIQKSAVSILDGSAEVTLADDIESVISKALGVDTLSVARSLIGQSDVDHIPLYDLVLEPSEDMGVEKTVQRVQCSIEFVKGDVVTVSEHDYKAGAEIGTALIVKCGDKVSRFDLQKGYTIDDHGEFEAKSEVMTSDPSIMRIDPLARMIDPLKKMVRISASPLDSIDAPRNVRIGAVVKESTAYSATIEVSDKTTISIAKSGDVWTVKNEVTPIKKSGARASFEIIQKNLAKQIVIGPVLIPDISDLQGDVISADVIEETAHKYLMSLNDRVTQGVQHKEMDVDDKLLKVVESYIAPCDMEIDGYKVLKGTWMLAMKILDSSLWKRVLNGEFKGFSIGAIKFESEPV